jgi:two-component system nitrogen regulation response regulator NtrX
MNRQYKILIVDDEEGIRTGYQDFFKDFDFIVETAASGAEGLEKLLVGEFDVAIVDVVMPTSKINGIEMIRQALAVDKVDTNFIVLTGQADKQDATDALNIGAKAWFEKSSIDMAKLLKRTQELAQTLPPEIIRRILSVIPDRN